MIESQWKKEKKQDVRAHLVIDVAKIIADDSRVERRAIQLAAYVFSDLEISLDQLMDGL